MKERPIIFSGTMIRAILEGRKTQTRRIVKPQPQTHELIFWREDDEYPSWVIGEALGVGENYIASCGRFIDCPFGKPGDRLWLRENFQLETLLNDISAGTLKDSKDAVRYCADGFVRGEAIDNFGRVRSGRFMPRWASRITLEVTQVRVERLQGISEEDAEAEGVYRSERHMDRTPWIAPDVLMTNVCGDRETDVPCHRTARDAFKCLWESIHGAGSWKDNPLVWCVSFKRIEDAEVVKRGEG